MAINFTNIVGQLAGLGFYDFVLPWLLFFAVVLGVLNKSQVFGTAAGKINSIIAAVIAFFITAFVPLGGIMAYYSTLFGVGGMVIGLLLLIVILAGSLGFNIENFGGTKDENGKTKLNAYFMPLLGLVLLVFASWAFSSATGGSINIPGVDSDTATVIFIVIFVLLAVYYAESGGKPHEEHNEKVTKG